MAGEEDDRNVHTGFGELALQIESVQSGEVHIQHQATRDLRAWSGQKLVRRFERPHPESRRANETAHRIAYRRIVIDKVHRGIDRLHWKTLPRSGSYAFSAAVTASSRASSLNGLLK